MNGEPTEWMNFDAMDALERRRVREMDGEILSKSLASAIERGKGAIAKPAREMTRLRGMRKTSLFISSVVMFLAGFYLVVDEIFWQTKILGVALVGGVAYFFGAYLQWVASKLKN